MDSARRQTLLFLIGGLVLSVGTPVLLAITRPDVAGYLFQPVILVGQILPYLLGAALWLPSRTQGVAKAGVVLAGVLFLSACLLYGSILVGLIPTGGDMIGLGFLMIDAITTVTVLVLTIIAFGVIRLRGRDSDGG